MSAPAMWQGALTARTPGGGLGGGMQKITLEEKSQAPVLLLPALASLAGKTLVCH